MPGGAEPKSELERLLMNELGGQIVAEHAVDPAETPDDSEDLSAIVDDTENNAPDESDPGLFDTDGED